MRNILIVNADSRLIPLKDESVQCVITSPPYWGLRSYLPNDDSHKSSELGLEQTPEQYVESIVQVFREVWRVLKKDGTLWLNLGDSYAGSGKCSSGGGGNSGLYKGKRAEWAESLERYGSTGVPKGLKPKDLVGIPWRVAFALQSDGWYLRQDIIWHKANSLPESVKDRCTKAHEYVFLLTKSARYYYDADAIKEPSKYPDDNRKSRTKFGQKRFPTNKITGVRPGSAFYPMSNKRSVWTVATQPYSGAHFATFPPKLIEPMILAGSKPSDIILDPFAGTGTVGVVARKYNRKFIGLELNPEYIELAKQRNREITPVMF